LLNSDALVYGGSGQGNLGSIEAAPVPSSGSFHSLNATLPPLGIVVFRPLE
jgi:1,4-alpha-glucan branching enzyme